MDPHKQKQMVNQLFEGSAKSQEELDKMSPDEKREYLRGRLKQRMFFNGVSRQSTYQKKKMQEKMEEATKKPCEEVDTSVTLSKTAIKNKKKREKKRALKAAEELANNNLAEENYIDNDVVIVKKDSESDYESDEN